MDSKLIGPLLLAAVVVLLFYRRARRSFGRQSVNTARLSMRMGVLCLLAVLLASAIWRDPRLVAALAGGILAGALLALLGLRHTRFETTAEGRFYTPHTYIGLLVLVLFAGRVIYRVAVAYPGRHADAGAMAANPLALYEHSPLTLTIIGLPIGYYVLYNLGILRRSRALLAAGPPGTTNS